MVRTGWNRLTGACIFFAAAAAGIVDVGTQRGISPAAAQPASSAAGCSQKMRWVRLERTTGTVTVPANGRCTFGLKPDAGITIEAVQITSPAKNGNATANGTSGYSYVPAPNFKGTDSFELSITASGGTKPRSAAVVTLNVTVQ